jgi:DNA-binding Lrp family transcriptional regulator
LLLPFAPASLILAVVATSRSGHVASNAAAEPRVIFVQFKCQLGKAYDVAARLVDDIDNTPQVYSTSGSYDLIARFHLDPEQDPGLFVTEVLQKIDGVAETHTIIGFNAFTPRHKTTN